MTTFGSTPAFSATWNNSGDFLAYLGLQWDQTKTFDAYGTITAEFAESRTGSGGAYSFIGVYGWSVDPCVEWYILDDWFGSTRFNPGTTKIGTADIDGGKYDLYSTSSSGTSLCTGVSRWQQFYSIRQTARTCGPISVTEHFLAWQTAGMSLGKLDSAKILVEVAGGGGTINFSTANVKTWL